MNPETNPVAALLANHEGVALVRQGQRDAARACFERAVQLHPACAPAHSNLGALLDDADAAIAHHRRAIEADPSYPLAHYNLGNALRRRGEPDAAAASYRAALALRPDLAEAQNALGNVLLDQGAAAEAEAAFAAATGLRPHSAMGHSNLAAARRHTGQMQAALAALDTAIALEPGYARAWANRGTLHRDLRHYDAALTDLARAAALAPDHVETVTRLVDLLRQLHRLTEALAVGRELAGRNPGSVEAQTLLASLLHETDDLDAAEAAGRAALALDPAHAPAHNTLGNIRRYQGQVSDAVACYRRALDLAPDAIGIRSNLLFALQFAAGVGPAEILAENQRWAALYETPLAGERRPHGNDRTPGRRLRVGYVCPYFYLHAAAFFLLPVLARHDPAQVEVLLYAGNARADLVTDKFKALGLAWRETAGLSDAELAEQVRADGVDVLVDVALHMSGSRLLAFARKPAPVQVTWLGYPGTTGLDAMDYRLTDPVLDPPGLYDAHYTERSIRLPQTFWCYAPIGPPADVSPLPALQAGHVTFGCFNTCMKVTGETVDLWARTLAAIPCSRITIMSQAGAHREAIRARFTEAGVSGDRVGFVPRAPHGDYLARYRQVDVCLDTTPYPGHTTTLDGLWMGVPVVSLVGPTVVGRGGLSILSNVGLRGLATFTEDAYVAAAAALVADLPALAGLRAGLRERLRGSVLMDAALFARDLERAYRRMWADWCGEDSKPPSPPA